MTDTGRRIGAVEARDPISGQPKSLEQLRHERNPIVLARKEGWEVGRFLGMEKFTKGERCIIDVEFYGQAQVFIGACIFSDTPKPSTLVRSTPDQVRAALRGTLCTCVAESKEIRAHLLSCPLSEVA
jgi:hypothetical protein